MQGYLRIRNDYRGEREPTPISLAASGKSGNHVKGLGNGKKETEAASFWGSV